MFTQFTTDKKNDKVYIYDRDNIVQQKPLYTISEDDSRGSSLLARKVSNSKKQHNLHGYQHNTEWRQSEEDEVTIVQFSKSNTSESSFVVLDYENGKRSNVPTDRNEYLNIRDEGTLNRYDQRREYSDTFDFDSDNQSFRYEREWSIKTIKPNAESKNSEIYYIGQSNSNIGTMKRGEIDETNHQNKRKKRIIKDSIGSIWNHKEALEEFSSSLIENPIVNKYHTNSAKNYFEKGSKSQRQKPTLSKVRMLWGDNERPSIGVSNGPKSISNYAKPTSTSLTKLAKSITRINESQASNSSLKEPYNLKQIKNLPFSSRRMSKPCSKSRNIMKNNACTTFRQSPVPSNTSSYVPLSTISRQKINNIVQISRRQDKSNELNLQQNSFLTIRESKISWLISIHIDNHTTRALRSTNSWLNTISAQTRPSIISDDPSVWNELSDASNEESKPELKFSQKLQKGIRTKSNCSILNNTSDYTVKTNRRWDTNLGYNTQNIANRINTLGSSTDQLSKAANLSRNRCVTRTDSIGPTRHQLSPKNDQKIIVLPVDIFDNNKSKSRSKRRQVSSRKLDFANQNLNIENINPYINYNNSNYHSTNYQGSETPNHDYSTVRVADSMNRYNSLRTLENSIQSKQFIRFVDDTDLKSGNNSRLQIKYDSQQKMLPKCLKIDLSQYDVSQIQNLSRIDIILN